MNPPEGQFEHTGELMELGSDGLLHPLRPDDATVANMRVSEDGPVVYPSGFHRDENGLLHRCVTYGRIVVLYLVLDVITEFATFKPVHDLFHYMGWI